MVANNDYTVCIILEIQTVSFRIRSLSFSLSFRLSPLIRREIAGRGRRINPSPHKKRISRPGTRVKNLRSGGPGPRRAADRVGQPGFRPNGDRPIPSLAIAGYSCSPLSSAAIKATCAKIREGVQVRLILHFNGRVLSTTCPQSPQKWLKGTYNGAIRKELGLDVPALQVAGLSAA
jgi:hypothetical protein